MLPDTTHFLLFITAAMLLNLTPGCDVLFIGSQNLVSKRHGLFALLGITTGVVIWIAVTIIGLTEVLHRSALAFNLVKTIGAIYLLYLAWQALFSRNTNSILLNQVGTKKVVHAYYKGVLTNILNPKVGLFFLTFLPQFVNTSRGHVWLQLLTLGICFVISCTLVNAIYMFLFNYLKNKVFSNPSFQKVLNRLTGVIFCALAFKVITARPN